MKLEKLLMDETRRKILRMTSEKDMTVTEIAQRLGLSKATISHHIKLLSDKQLIRVVKTEISGNFIRKYYRSAFGDVKPLSKTEEFLISNLREGYDKVDIAKALLRGIGIINVQAGNELFLKKIGFDIGYHILANLIEDEDLKNGIAKLWDKFDLGEITEFGNGKIVVENCYFCGGLPYSGYTYCKQDEGILEGIMLRKHGDRFLIKEVECWGTGKERCTFEIKRI